MVIRLIFRMSSIVTMVVLCCVMSYLNTHNILSGMFLLILTRPKKQYKTSHKYKLKLNFNTKMSNLRFDINNISLKLCSDLLKRFFV